MNQTRFTYPLIRFFPKYTRWDGEYFLKVSKSNPGLDSNYRQNIINLAVERAKERKSDIRYSR